MFKINQSILVIIQIISSTLLVILILLQQRGGGLSSAFGGESAGFLSYRSRRGFEKLVFILTVIVSASFLAVSLLLSTYK